MMAAARRPRPLILVLAALLALAAAWLARGVVGRIAARAIESEARARGAEVSYRSLTFDYPARITATSLTLTGAAAETLLAAESLAVDLAPLPLLVRRVQPVAVTMAHARLAAPSRTPAADPDTLAPAEDEKDGSGPAAPRVRAQAAALVRVLLLPARQMPRLDLRDVRLAEDGRALRLRVLALERAQGGARLIAAGVFDGARGPMPFEADLAYGADDRLVAGLRIVVRDPESGATTPLRATVSGRVTQDRAGGRVIASEPLRITAGALGFRVLGDASRDGPAFRFRLEADSLTGDRIQSSLPASWLGPLALVETRGAFDYRFGLDLDLARPDSVRFAADVIPRGLALAPGTRLRLAGLDAPFTAAIHLPRDRVVQREVSPANPDFVPLGEMDSLLVRAVLANEDGGFFRHRGFSEEAVEEAIAHNLRAGAFRRGAGTITMQLARNLYLGHERTVARKAQEVVLAWVLEHLAGVSKQRLLEIYLNVIEWGPGVHGANEAARFYFGRDARRLTLAESLFLTIVIPSPARWRWRLDAGGDLRPFARAQMHFIARAMVAKGWLSAAELPPAAALAVTLAGPARDVLFPPADTLSAAAQRPSVTITSAVWAETLTSTVWEGNPGALTASR